MTEDSKSPRSEVRDQRSEVRGQRTAKARDQQKADVRGQMTDGSKNRKKTKDTITKARKRGNTKTSDRIHRINRMNCRSLKRPLLASLAIASQGTERRDEKTSQLIFSSEPSIPYL
jgi:hypothetical protein